MKAAPDLCCVLHDFSGNDSGQMLAGVESVWPLLMIASSAFQAGASIIKVKAMNSLFVCSGSLYKQNF